MASLHGSSVQPRRRYFKSLHTHGAPLMRVQLTLRRFCIDRVKCRCESPLGLCLSVCLSGQPFPPFLRTHPVARARHRHPRRKDEGKRPNGPERAPRRITIDSAFIISSAARRSAILPFLLSSLTGARRGRVNSWPVRCSMGPNSKAPQGRVVSQF